MNTGDTNPLCERIDGMKPENSRYNASIGALMGIGMPAKISNLDVIIENTK